MSYDTYNLSAPTESGTNAPHWNHVQVLHIHGLEPPSTNLSPVTLPYLHKLTLGYTDVGHAVELLSILNAPALQQLNLGHLHNISSPHGGPNHPNSTRLFEYLSRSQPIQAQAIQISLLRRIRLFNVYVDTSVLGAFFRRCSSLDTLELDDCAVNLQFALVLTLFPGDVLYRSQSGRCRHELLPALRTVICRRNDNVANDFLERTMLHHIDSLPEVVQQVFFPVNDAPRWSTWRYEMHPDNEDVISHILQRRC
ncbi:hypothetical protein PUNSTDRAFT_45020 [Punctularia strigosozonata HHB-11173 SS5]|uniref:uncharacterized protein n=1 Tax=Punctularia strigosozonata (strain HHB-11173) TaxID=741275 RepID=UPI0004417537|nr:uncharacterized protein PUNSTDRAFT_45020 [Punctularia strigosozonata HHB-11173 SS5]EIN08536.1 hypothetical protein PUNSTDRAFT_45020 [Punctularia strigosozonata HHB-11173 SS5]